MHNILFVPSGDPWRQIPFFKWLLLCPIFLLLQPVWGKVSSGSALLTGEKTEHLLTKFAVSPGREGKFSMTLRIPASAGMYTDERDLRVHLFADRNWWKKALPAPTCRKKVPHADRALPVVFNLVSAWEDGEERQWKQRGAPTAGQKWNEDMWVARVESGLSLTGGHGNPRKTAYWYVTLDDCMLEEKKTSIEDAPEMKFEYTVLNGSVEEKGHFSADELDAAKLNFFHYLVSLALLLAAAFATWRTAGKRGSVHLSLLLTMVAIFCDASSLFMELLHDMAYRRNGYGNYFADCLASHFEAQSDGLVASVLLMVGCGWTLPNSDGGSLRNVPGALQSTVEGLRNPATAFQKKEHPAAALIMIIMAAHSALAQWGRTYDGEFDSYHSLEHFPGTVLMSFRCALGLAFLVGSHSLRSSGRVPPALNGFLIRFAVLGTTWFASLPLVSRMVSTFVPYRNMHLWLSVGSATVQICALAGLVWLFTADSGASAYHRLSSVQNTNSDLGSTIAPPGGKRMPELKFGKTKIRVD